MPSRTSHVDAWQAAHGGLRGSTMLRWGALVAVISVLLQAGGNLVTGGGWGLGSFAWAGWIFALTGLGVGFIWVGGNPVLGRTGLVVGIAHLVHGAFLLLAIFTAVPLVVSLKGLAVGRLLLVIIFAVQERHHLGPRGAAILSGAAGLMVVKAMLPVAGFDPELGLVGAVLRDAVPALLLSLALLHTADLVRDEEDRWALEAPPRGRGRFDDFNNPYHDGGTDPD